MNDKDLQRAIHTAQRVRDQLALAAPTSLGEVDADRGSLLKRRLSSHTHLRQGAGRLDAGFYEEPELQAYLLAQVHGQLEHRGEVQPPAPPASTSARVSGNAVLVRWDPGQANRLLAGTLARQGDDPALAFRVYRGIDGPPTELAATLPFGVERWRDTALPLARARISYQVWAILVRDRPEGEVLLEAEPGDMVTVATPEHFNLRLLGGDPTVAVFQVEVGLPAAPIGSSSVSVRTGDPLRVGEMSTGLVVQSIDVRSEERLTTQSQLVLNTDGSIVLDPLTQEPRTTQTQVLVPVTRLVVVLADPAGQLRTLEVDLP